jgi:RNA polymerase sigma factor (sigma-70 family)
METEADVGRLVEHLFRQEAGKIVSALTGIFGLRNLELVEDAVQEALLKALRQWSYGKIPPNPAAWLMQVAKNQALDMLRRNTRFQEREEEIAAVLLQHPALSAQPAITFTTEEIRDDQLRMIFACCHPELASENQAALTLKTLCAFSVGEISRAFLTSPETVAKRLTRARDRLRKAAVPFEIPTGPELSNRLDSVLDVLYLLFNEGYNASHGEDVIRRDLCDEAIRLATLLQEHPAGDEPRTHALLALFLLQAAHFPARIDASGDILLLPEQDRTRWDQEMIAKGLSHLNRSASGEEASVFHLQAGIAACHCTAKRYEETDWARILSLYDLLSTISDSPVIALNRAVAVARVRGPAAGLKAVAEIKNREALQNYYLFYAVLAEFCLKSKRYGEAEDNYRHALTLTSLPAEQSFLREGLARCETNRAEEMGAREK